MLKEIQRLCAENELLKKLSSFGFGRRAMPAQKTQVVQKLMPRATFYYHLKRMNRPDKYETAKTEITAIYHENKGRYGYCRITAELHRRKIPLNHKTVQRLIRVGLSCQDEEVSFLTKAKLAKLSQIC